MESSHERAVALNGERVRELIERRRRDLARGLTRVKHFGVQRVDDIDHERAYRQAAQRDLASILAAAAAREAAALGGDPSDDEEE